MNNISANPSGVDMFNFVSLIKIDVRTSLNVYENCRNVTGDSQRAVYSRNVTRIILTTWKVAMRHRLL